MTVPVSLLPTLVTIPAGVYNGAAMDSFRLGRTPVTNAQYNTHVDRYLNRPYVLLQTNPETHATSVLCSMKTPKEAIGDLAEHLPEDWDRRTPLLFGVFTLFQLRKDMSPEGFDRPNHPVVNVSWFHAFEYCVGNGFFLPSDDQWSYAAGLHEGREYATSTGRLYAADGKTKLAHFGDDEKDGTNRTIDVDDPRYPDGPHGLRHMTAEVWEWVARNSSLEWPYGLRGGSWHFDDSVGLRAFSRGIVNGPGSRGPGVGFRVGAPAP
jgi:formylglycine-generating enzyme required for sulfatase activity